LQAGLAAAPHERGEEGAAKARCDRQRLAPLGLRRLGFGPLSLLPLGLMPALLLLAEPLASAAVTSTPASSLCRAPAATGAGAVVLGRW
jgi:hypothetical protein